MTGGPVTGADDVDVLCGEHGAPLHRVAVGGIRCSADVAPADVCRPTWEELLPEYGHELVLEGDHVLDRIPSPERA